MTSELINGMKYRLDRTSSDILQKKALEKVASAAQLLDNSGFYTEAQVLDRFIKSLSAKMSSENHVDYDLEVE